MMTPYATLTLLLTLAAPLPAQDRDPSRDLVAFASDRDGRGDIFVMRGDGSFPTRLTPCSDDDRPEGWVKAAGAAWSPDGARIAFHVYREGKPRALCVMQRDGTERRVLVGDRDASDATWSPDGSRLAFRSDGNLWTVAADGGTPTLLTEVPGDARGAEWSPDGKQIVFSAGRSEQGARLEDLYVLELATGDIRQLTELGGEASIPSWSPDGEWIAFNTGDEDCADLALIRPGGGEPRLLARTGKLYGPSWSPDGKVLYATGFFDENNDVYAFPVDGSEMYRLSNQPGDENWVSVCPVPAEPLGEPDPARVHEALDVATVASRNGIGALHAGNRAMAAQQFGKAVRFYRMVVTRDPGFGRVWYRLGLALQQDGQHDEAVEAYGRAVVFPRYAARAHYSLACLYATTGRTDAAFDALDSAIQTGFRDQALLEQDPDLASLREDPRFKELRERGQ